MRKLSGAIVIDVTAIILDLTCFFVFGHRSGGLAGFASDTVSEQRAAYEQRRC
jgi:hypothetical protein